MSAEQPSSSDGGLSRRTALKRGAAVAAVCWATPVVQVLSVRTADAASGAQPPRTGGPPAHVPPAKGRVEHPPTPPTSRGRS